MESRILDAKSGQNCCEKRGGGGVFFQSFTKSVKVFLRLFGGFPYLSKARIVNSTFRVLLLNQSISHK